LNLNNELRNPRIANIFSISSKSLSYLALGFPKRSIKIASFNIQNFYIIKNEADYQAFFHILAWVWWFWYTYAAGRSGGVLVGPFEGFV